MGLPAPAATQLAPGVMGAPPPPHHPPPHHGGPMGPQNGVMGPQNGVMGPMNGYRCGSNTSSSSGRGSSLQHASLPRHFSNRTVSSTVDMNSPLSEVPIITNGLPQIPLPQHHNLVYNTANKNRPPGVPGPQNGVMGPQNPPLAGQIHPYSNTLNNSNYYYNRPNSNTQQYNSHYKLRKQAPPPSTNGHTPVNNTAVQGQNDYGILKFNPNGNVGKEIDV